MLIEITTGPDGNVWFTEASGDKIGRVSLFGAVTDFPVPTLNSVPSLDFHGGLLAC